MKKIIITQSNYIPWKGYFDSIKAVDEVILYDDMQYTKRDWRNRNKIKTPQGIKWLSIPVEVKGKFFQSIKDTKISNPKWNVKHWQTIKQNYSKASYYKQYKEFFENLYLGLDEVYLSQINYILIKSINNLLKINTPVKFSSEFQLVEGKTERLVDLCKQVRATDYYSGPAARNYMNETLFKQEGINVHYFDYSGYSEYSQLYPPFEHSVSIIDLIFNEGNNAANFMKNNSLI